MYPVPSLAALRAEFPQLSSGRVYLDNAAGGFLPQCSIDAVAGHLARYGATNALPGHLPGQAMIALKHTVRSGTALFLNAEAEDVALGPSATALAFRLSAAFSQLWQPGDEVILSGLEHEANASPWRDLTRFGLNVRVWHARQPDMHLHLDDLHALLGPRTRLVAVTAASNTLGVTPNLPAITELARQAGAWTVIDAVHAAPHTLPDVQAWGADFVTFSPYKVFGPHLGALWINPAHRENLPWPKLTFFMTGDIAGIEHGSAPFELLAGWGATLNYLHRMGGGEAITRSSLHRAYQRIQEFERPVMERLLEGLLGTPGLTLYGPPTPEGRVGTFAFRMNGETPDQTAERLTQQGIDVGAGHFYAVQPLTDLNLYPTGVVRASIAHYTTLEDAERFLTALHQ